MKLIPKIQVSVAIIIILNSSEELPIQYKTSEAYST